MKTLHFLTTMLLLSLITISCDKQKNNANTKNETELNTETKKPKITLEALKDSPAYLDAILQLEEPKNTNSLKVGEIDFKFTLNNYELGKQTESANTKTLANSGKGQHIHFILNNEPYSAHYSPSFKKEIPEGVHHLVAFLSRSYHESVKNENSVVVKKIKVGENATDANNLDMSAPTLIYSRPKGKYVGKDTENLLLDFFVLNTTLSENGNKVKAIINEEEFIITKWVPHIIKGLPMGDVTIQLELLDAHGNFIPGPFNKVTRTVTLTE